MGYNVAAISKGGEKKPQEVEKLNSRTSFLTRWSKLFSCYPTWTIAQHRWAVCCFTLSRAAAERHENRGKLPLSRPEAKTLHPSPPSRLLRFESSVCLSPTGPSGPTQPTMKRFFSIFYRASGKRSSNFCRGIGNTKGPAGIPGYLISMVSAAHHWRGN